MHSKQDPSVSGLEAPKSSAAWQVSGSLLRAWSLRPGGTTVLGEHPKSR